MENDKSNFRQENVFSSRVKAGKRRTYFFDIRQTKGEDYYLSLTESTKKFNGDGYERHKIFIYKEDVNRFVEGLEAAVKHLKENLMPDYDFEEYNRRQEEWEARRAEEGFDGTPYHKRSQDGLDGEPYKAKLPDGLDGDGSTQAKTNSEDEMEEDDVEDDGIPPSKPKSEEDMVW